MRGHNVVPFVSEHKSSFHLPPPSLPQLFLQCVIQLCLPSLFSHSLFSPFFYSICRPSFSCSLSFSFPSLIFILSRPLTFSLSFSPDETVMFFSPLHSHLFLLFFWSVFFFFIESSSLEPVNFWEFCLVVYSSGSQTVVLESPGIRWGHWENTPYYVKS